MLVPTEALTADVREGVLEDVRQQDSESVMAAVAELIARAERAETEADHHRKRADAAEARVAGIEQDRKHADSVIASLEADLAAANARAKAAEASTEAAQKQAAQETVEALRQAEARKATGRWARLRAAWRGE